MAERGVLRDSYAAALQHDLIELDGDERLIGVVRRPMYWFESQVDENRPVLGPPPELLDEVKARHEALQDRGLSDTEAHNQALDDVDYESRYRSHLDGSPEAQEAIQYIEAVLDRGTDVVLVCYENTDEKRCHRTLLKSRIASRQTM